jgi:magnesium/cobalt transport protein CorA
MAVNAFSPARERAATVRFVTAAGVEAHREGDVPALLAREGGFLWVDVPECDAEAAELLSDVFHFHPLGVRACQERVALPKIHAYADHFFIVLHGVEPVGGDGGRLHTQELSMFLSQRYVVTVHGRPEEGAPGDLVARETEAVLARLESGRLRPKLPGELAHAIVTGLARRLEALLGAIAGQILELERLVMKGHARGHEALLEQMFRVRHQLLTVRTIATQSREVHARMAALTRAAVPATAFWVEDLLDYFDRLRNVSDGQKELLQEVLDFYQTRIANDLSRFVKRLTSVGAILVSDTLIAGIYGMNFVNMPELSYEYGYPLALGMMAVVSLALVIFFRRRDWL